MFQDDDDEDGMLDDDDAVSDWNLSKILFSLYTFMSGCNNSIAVFA